MCAYASCYTWEEEMALIIVKSLHHSEITRISGADVCNVVTIHIIPVNKFWKQKVKMTMNFSTKQSGQFSLENIWIRHVNTTWIVYEFMRYFNVLQIRCNISKQQRERFKKVSVAASFLHWYLIAILILKLDTPIHCQVHVSSPRDCQYFKPND